MRNFLALAVIALAACGGSVSAIDVCKSGCDKTFSCSGGTTEQIQSCKDACSSSNALGTSLASCTNGNAILSCVDGCYGIGDCNKSAACVSGCPKCITTNAPPMTDGGMSSDAAVAGDECSKFCGLSVMCDGADMAGATDCHTNCETALAASCQSGNPNFTCYIGCGSSDTCTAFDSCVQSCPAC